jgi:hypothetical protein
MIRATSVAPYAPHSTMVLHASERNTVVSLQTNARISHYLPLPNLHILTIHNHLPIYSAHAYNIYKYQHTNLISVVTGLTIS